jgi:hypothetical protein
MASGSRAAKLEVLGLEFSMLFHKLFFFEVGKTLVLISIQLMHLNSSEMFCIGVTG